MRWHCPLTALYAGGTRLARTGAETNAALAQKAGAYKEKAIRNCMGKPDKAADAAARK